MISSNTPIIVYKFITVNYEWPEGRNKELSVMDGSFIPSNNIITGLKVYKDRVFVSVPRWRQGVPSTLNEIVPNTNNNNNNNNNNNEEPYVLRPFPSWNMQTIGNCSCLQYVQSMEIDPSGRMWIIDTGRINIFDNTTIPDNSCPPKILLWDLNTNQLISSYIFPDDVVPYNSSFLNDLVIDITQEVAYISDVLGPQPGAIVVYKHQEQTSHRFTDPTMKHDPSNSPASTIHINNYILNTTTSQDGIALSPDAKYIYYCPMASFNLYRIPTSTLLNQENDLETRSIQSIGSRRSQMDGMTFSNNSVLYFGSFSDNGIATWQVSTMLNVTEMEEIVYVNATSMQWQDTWAWDDKGYVWWTTNRLHRYFLQNMNWNGGEGANMRICKMYVGASSYMMYQWPNDDDSNSSLSLANIILIALLIVLLGAMVYALASYAFLYQKRKQQYTEMSTYHQMTER